MEGRSLFFLVFGIVAVAGYQIDPLIYLHKYGYARPGRSSAHDLKKSIKSFQRFFHLPVTGEIDKATKAIMEMPRCGVPDIDTSTTVHARRVRRYAESKYHWTNRTLTYQFENYSPDLGRGKTREIIERAFHMWNSVARIYFQEQTTGIADIMIRFQAGDHNCKSKFDGPGGVLAHAFYPENGDSHFDEDEDFTDGTDQGINLFFVAAHEFGHALGLPHSTVFGSLMYPTYYGYKANFKLPPDDTGAIQALYGCKTEQKTGSYPKVSAPAKGLLLEQWSNLRGYKIEDLRPMTCRFPHTPDKTRVLKTAEMVEEYGKNTGLKMRGYYTPDATGYYKFFLVTSKQGQIWLSHNTGPAGKTMIVETEWRTHQEFTEKHPSSGLVYLEGGRPYYLEGLQSSRYDYNYFKIGVQEPGSQTIVPLSEDNMKWMITDQDIRVLLCNGRYETINCPQDYKIEITQAAYGRHSDQEQYIWELCTQSKALWQYRDCAVEGSLAKTKKKCDGKQTCLLHASRDFYGMDCGLKFHHVLDVTYKCVKTLGVKPTAKAVTTAAPGTVCEDHPKYAMYCLYSKEEGDCERYAVLYKKRCPATCGFCKATKPALCMDDYQSGAALKCHRWKEEGYCTSKRQSRNMRKYCRQTCGLCPNKS